jgi:hypothetical protein
MGRVIHMSKIQVLLFANCASSAKGDAQILWLEKIQAQPVHVIMLARRREFIHGTCAPVEAERLTSLPVTAVVGGTVVAAGRMRYDGQLGSHHPWTLRPSAGAEVHIKKSSRSRP